MTAKQREAIRVQIVSYFAAPYLHLAKALSSPRVWETRDNARRIRYLQASVDQDGEVCDYVDKPALAGIGVKTTRY